MSRTVPNQPSTTVEAGDLTVGWIGTGRMGAAMVARLARPGFEPIVWNRTRSKAEPLRDKGCVLVEHITQLRSVDVVFTMVSTAEDLKEVLFGAGGLLTVPTRVPPVLVDSSTIDMAAAAEIRSLCAEAGVHLIAAPVSGNAHVVEAGQLTMAASGRRDLFDVVHPLLLRIANSVTYVGAGDEARLVKISHNLMLGVVTQCLAEITVLTERGGVTRAAFLDFLNNSVMGSTFTRYKTPAFVNLDYTPTFTPPLLRKDFDLGLDAARAHGVPVPVVAATAQAVQASVGAGRNDEDFAILLDLVATGAGIELTSEGVVVSDGLRDQQA